MRPRALYTPTSVSLASFQSASSFSWALTSTPCGRSRRAMATMSFCTAPCSSVTGAFAGSGARVVETVAGAGFSAFGSRMITHSSVLSTGLRISEWVSPLADTTKTLRVSFGSTG